ncbi:hypothetical protein Tco_0894419 [Tanacetum coccineum]|uniref:Uncharacterized protein n=1 Tax=Tanacetum coccineum TaxID=301880 RepID=A0ABQ5CEI2_9ASTR
MVISSPCLTDIKNWLVQKQTTFGKDFLNPFTADSLLKTIWFSTHHASHAPCYSNEALAILEQTATSKEKSNLFMAGEDCWVLEDFTTYYSWFNIGAASEDLVLLRKIEENRLSLYSLLSDFQHRFIMDDPNITMEEYPSLEEEKARRQAIVFDDTSNATLSCEPTISPIDNNKIDFNISFDEFDDEDYMVIFDKNSFSHKVISIDNLKTDSEDENDKVKMPSFLSPEPTFGYIDNLDFFKDFENEFPAIAYNDLKSKSDPPIKTSDRIDVLDSDVLYSNSHRRSCLAILGGVDMAPLPHRDLRHPWLRYQVEGYEEGIVYSYEHRLETIFRREVNRVHVLDFAGLISDMRQTLADRLSMLGGARRRMTWRQFILALCLNSEEEMTEAGHAQGRKSIARLSVGHFIGCLAAHFVLVSDEGLTGLSIIARELPGPKRQQDAAAGAFGAAKDAPAADEGAQDVPAPMQAP